MRCRISETITHKFFDQLGDPLKLIVVTSQRAWHVLGILFSNSSPRTVTLVDLDLFFPIHKSATQPPDLGPTCFDTFGLHLKPPGRKAAPPGLGRWRERTGTATSRNARIREQLGPSLAETGQNGGGRSDFFGVVRGGLPGGSVEGKAFLVWAEKRRMNFLVSQFHPVFTIIFA